LTVKYTEAVEQSVVDVLLQLASDDTLRPRRQLKPALDVNELALALPLIGPTLVPCAMWTTIFLLFVH
jgi:hypothetical protein